jgi:hypothetical protein
MHDRLVNEVAMGKRFALIIGCTLASADAFRRRLGHLFHSAFAGAPGPSSRGYAGQAGSALPVSFTAHSPALPARRREAMPGKLVAPYLRCAS